MSSPFPNPERFLPSERAPTPKRGAAALWAAAWLVAVGAGACTQIQVEETHVTWELAPSCPDGGAVRGGGGPNSPPQQQSGAVMDTYVVEIFELTDPQVSTAQDCEICLATRANCFLEEASCVCGDQAPVSPDHLHEMLGGVRIALPAKHTSLYCLRAMAVQRTSNSESCQCDPDWQLPDRVRLCALSRPYAASPLPPIEMQVQCNASDSAFRACVGSKS